MASDYGDEAGGKLLDWMLRIGQEAGAEAMARSARELSERLAGIRGWIGYTKLDSFVRAGRVRRSPWRTQSTPGISPTSSSGR